MDIIALKKSRGNSLQKLTQAVESQSKSNKFKEDDRFWSPKVDDNGNGYAVIRFLPEPPNEDFPWFELYSRQFQGPGGWYIENDLRSIGQPDPVGEMCSRLWNTGVDADKETARKYRQNKRYICNVFVIKDPANPDNEGKVRLYKVNKVIFEKIQSAMKPQYADEKAFNPFDLWEGANFKIKMRTVDKYLNFDKSEFDVTGPLFDDDDKLAQIWNSEHSLKAFGEASNYKTYEKLAERLHKVLGDYVGTGVPVLSEGKAAPATEKPKSTADRLAGKNDESKSTPKTVASKPPEDEDDAPLDKFEEKTKASIANALSNESDEVFFANLRNRSMKS